MIKAFSYAVVLIVVHEVFVLGLDVWSITSEQIITDSTGRCDVSLKTYFALMKG